MNRDSSWDRAIGSAGSVEAALQNAIPVRSIGHIIATPLFQLHLIAP
jgi:hypothetical protein